MKFSLINTGGPGITNLGRFSADQIFWTKGKLGPTFHLVFLPSSSPEGYYFNETVVHCTEYPCGCISTEDNKILLTCKYTDQECHLKFDYLQYNNVYVYIMEVCDCFCYKAVLKQNFVRNTAFSVFCYDGNGGYNYSGNGGVR